MLYVQKPFDAFGVHYRVGHVLTQEDVDSWEASDEAKAEKLAELSRRNFVRDPDPEPEPAPKPVKDDPPQQPWTSPHSTESDP